MTRAIIACSRKVESVYKSEHSKARNLYHKSEAKFNSLKKTGQFAEARKTLDEISELIRENSDEFDELSDRLSILEARKVNLRIEAERIRGRTQQDLFRELANLSIPSICMKQPCPPADDGSSCLSQTALLSPRQSKMCFIRLKALADALKCEAGHAAQVFNYDDTLAKRELASKIHRSALKLNSSKPHVQHQAYLDYWLQITKGYVYLLKGQFEESRKAFAQALETSRIPKIRMFPNYFRSRAEIAAHEYYIDGVERVSLSDFLGAKSKFSTWLDANTDGKPSLRTENIAIFVAICDILSRIPVNNLQPHDWRKLEQLLKRRYTAKTTWALWRRLEWLKELSIKTKSTRSVFTGETLKEEVNNFAKEWKLFVLDAVLPEEDQEASLERKVSYSSLIDILNDIDPYKHDWRGLLVQNLRHMLLLMADYEYLRYLDPPADDAKHTMTNPLKYTENMSCKKLYKIVMYYLRIRSEAHAMTFAHAEEDFDRFHAAIDNGEFPAAIDAQRSFFDAIRFWPHVIVVNEQSNLPHHVYMNEDAPELFTYITRARRLWREIPNTIEFEGLQRLNIGSYYYLRP